jgi:hypothetical protein
MWDPISLLMWPGQRLAGAGRTLAHRRFRSVSSLVPMLALLLALAASAALAACSPFGGANSALPPSKSTQSVPSQRTSSSPVQSQLASDVLRSVWSLGVKQLTTTYESQSASATVTITLGGAVPTTPAQISAAQELTKAYCLMALQALWTSGVPLSQTLVTVEGPTQDEYADVVNQPYGAVTLGSVTARQIGWSHVSVDTAWNDYPGAFLRPNYVLVD